MIYKISYIIYKISYILYKISCFENKYKNGLP